MFIITNLQLEREIDYKSTKVYILSLRISKLLFTNDMDF